MISFICISTILIQNPFHKRQYEMYNVILCCILCCLLLLFFKFVNFAGIDLLCY